MIKCNRKNGCHSERSIKPAAHSAAGFYVAEESPRYKIQKLRKQKDEIRL